MFISPITADAFNESIKQALSAPKDITESVSRISRMIRKLPGGKLYASVHGNEVAFHVLIAGHQKYMSKTSRETLMLARKTYLMLLQEILELTESKRKSDIKRRRYLIEKLQKFICLCERGNLDIARIVLTSKQYKWFTGQFRQKNIDVDKAKTTSCGLPVRSKSERDIANAQEALAVPFHYEEQTVIYVRDLIDNLEDSLRGANKLRGRLYYVSNNTTHWNVPPELEWMNAPGSIWKTYDPINGTIVIHNDFKIILADDEIVVWEHEGLMEEFIYRCNASERASIMKYTGTISKGNLIETYEQDIDTPEKVVDIIARCILPRLWF